MESPNIHKLAERFWQGECSEAEEAQLRERLRYGKTPAGLEVLADYFRMLEEERSLQPLDESFDKAVMTQIEPRKQSRVRPLFWLQLAAGIVLLAALTFTVANRSQRTDNTAIKEAFADTYEDPETAFQEVRKALFKVSNNLNSGLKPTQKLGEFHKATQSIER